MIFATSRMSLSLSASESLPTSCTISVRSSSVWRTSFMMVRIGGNSGWLSSYHGSSARRYLEYESSQWSDGKCLRWASFLSRPQKTWTMPRVAAHTGSEKSPPGGETAPTMEMEPVRVGGLFDFRI